jgi:hypothetical protein
MAKSLFLNFLTYYTIMSEEDVRFIPFFPTTGSMTSAALVSTFTYTFAIIGYALKP